MNISVSGIDGLTAELTVNHINEVMSYITDYHGIDASRVDLYDNVYPITLSKKMYDAYVIEEGTEITYIINERTRRLPSDMTTLSMSEYRLEELCEIYGPIEQWDTSFVTNMSTLFKNCHTFNKDISRWDVSSVTNMSKMFEFCYKFNQPIQHWDVSSVENTSGMFSYAITFNQPIGRWKNNTSNLRNTSDMFHMASVFNQPLGEWNVSNVKDMSGMFSYTSKFNQPLENWKTSSVTTLARMFERARAFNQPIHTWDVSNVKDMSYMFYNTNYLLPISNWNVRNDVNTFCMVPSAYPKESIPPNSNFRKGAGYVQ